VLREIDGNITRNTVVTPRTGTGKPQISLVVRVRAELAALVIDPAAVRAESQVVAELEIAPVVVGLAHAPVVAELAHGLAVAELEHDPVEGALAHDQAAVERVRVRVEAVLEPSLLRAQVAVVALRTKLVTEARRRDLVRLIAAVALAVAAETTRVPAATGAVIAWAVAVTAAAGAGIVVAVE
jgi:hypothetical protein